MTKIKVKVPEQTGRTALFNTAVFANLKCAQALLAYRADPLLKDNKGRTPLMIARQNLEDLRACKVVHLLSEGHIPVLEKILELLEEASQ